MEHAIAPTARPITFAYAEVAGLIYMRAPNRFRKLLIDAALPKEDRDAFGLDFSVDSKNLECVAKQRREFPDIQGRPIGFQATWDNDVALCWDQRDQDT